MKIILNSSPGPQRACKCGVMCEFHKRVCSSIIQVIHENMELYQAQDRFLWNRMHATIPICQQILENYFLSTFLIIFSKYLCILPTAVSARPDCRVSAGEHHIEKCWKSYETWDRSHLLSPFHDVRFFPKRESRLLWYDLFLTISCSCFLSYFFHISAPK